MSTSFMHGTTVGYEKHHCRCEKCRLTHNERVRRNRADRLASGRLSHGTRSAWDAGCRCDKCLTARRASYEREKAARREASDR